MDRFLLLPQATFHSIQELESLVPFQYLSRINFENEEDKEEIQLRGFRKQEEKQISRDALANGKK